MSLKDTIWQLTGVVVLGMLATSYISQHATLSNRRNAAPSTQIVTLDRTWHDGCYDGDTCQFLRADGSAMRIRLARIDSPELSSACRNAAHAARARLLQLLSLGELRVDSLRTGHYGRTIAEVYVYPRSVAFSKLNVSDALLSEGLAQHYPSSTCNP